ncbi:MAG TPA: hypothetical protein VMX55_01625 [candidate division Zixibacteria bacterium]|nr:hypothetical protein [candidate division Zixibacteria bacterium]
MISNPEEISHLVIQALENYEFALKAKRSLSHQKAFEYCGKAMNKIAIASYILSNEEVTEEEIALSWVKELPVPNGLFPMIIKAVNEIDNSYFPLLNFVMSYPTSSRNIYLIEDALEELFTNIENHDDEKDFQELLNIWRARL